METDAPGPAPMAVDLKVSNAIGFEPLEKKQKTQANTSNGPEVSDQKYEALRDALSLVPISNASVKSTTVVTSAQMTCSADTPVARNLFGGGSGDVMQYQNPQQVSQQTTQAGCSISAEKFAMNADRMGGSFHAPFGFWPSQQQQ